MGETGGTGLTVSRPTDNAGQVPHGPARTLPTHLPGWPAFFNELGHSAAPVVVDNADEHNHWAGFRPDKIDALVVQNV